MGYRRASRSQLAYIEQLHSELGLGEPDYYRLQSGKQASDAIRKLLKVRAKQERADEEQLRLL